MPALRAASSVDRFELVADGQHRNKAAV